MEIDDDVLEAVRSLARARGHSRGRVLSDLARRALTPPTRGGTGFGGFPTFIVEAGAPPVTLERIHAALDEA